MCVSVYVCVWRIRGWQWLGNGGNVHKTQLAIWEIQNVLEILLLWRIVKCLEGSLQVL